MLISRKRKSKPTNKGPDYINAIANLVRAIAQLVRSAGIIIWLLMGLSPHTPVESGAIERVARIDGQPVGADLV